MIFRLSTDKLFVLVYEVIDFPEVINLNSGSPKPRFESLSKYMWALHAEMIVNCDACRRRVDTSFAALSAARFKVNLCEICYKERRLRERQRVHPV